MSNNCPTEFSVNDRNRAERGKKRANYEKAPIYAIIDGAPICHVGFTHESQPFVIPTIHARKENVLYFHGSTQSRLIQAIASGQSICATFTFLDGIIVARSAMHHSMNYRSVVVFGTGKLVTDQDEKNDAFMRTVEKLLPGRWNECRHPNEAEDKATTIAALQIEDASLKSRSGGPSDIESDYEGPYWAGQLPIETVFKNPIPCERLVNQVTIPEHIKNLIT